MYFFLTTDGLRVDKVGVNDRLTWFSSLGLGVDGSTLEGFKNCVSFTLSIT